MGWHLLISGTWRSNKAEIWETQQGHIFMGAGKFENKHGVGLLVIKKWRKHSNWTELVHQRTSHGNVDHSQQTTCIVDECVLLPLEYADHHVERAYRSIEKLTKSTKKSIQIVG